MKQPLVSVLCVSYNHVQFIRPCLESILQQQCNFKFEILIHDDASTDGTQEIIKEFQEKHPNLVKPIFQSENQWSKKPGSINLRFNYPRAKGKYLAVCEGDDFWIGKNKLQEQIDFLESHKDYNLICGGYNMIKNGQSHDIIYNKLASDNSQGFSFGLNELRDWFIRPSTAVFKNLKQDTNLLEKHNYSFDIHVFYYLLKTGKGYYQQKILAGYNRHKGGVYSSKTNREVLVTQYIIMHDFYKKEPSEFIRVWYFNLGIKLIELKISLLLTRSHYRHLLIDTSAVTLPQVYKSVKALIRTSKEKKAFYRSMIPLYFKIAVRKIKNINKPRR